MAYSSTHAIEILMNTPSNNQKNTPNLNLDISIHDDHGNIGMEDIDEAVRQFPQDGERSNLDDGIDDDNENPTSQTLVDAAENTGPQTIDETRELAGEVDEDGGE